MGICAVAAASFCLTILTNIMKRKIAEIAIAVSKSLLPLKLSRNCLIWLAGSLRQAQGSGHSCCYANRMTLSDRAAARESKSPSVFFLFVEPKLKSKMSLRWKEDWSTPWGFSFSLSNSSYIGTLSCYGKKQPADRRDVRG